MRVEVTGWSRLETRGSQIAFKANKVNVHLTAEEVTRYGVEACVQVNGTGFFHLLLDAYTDMKYLSVGKKVLPSALREHIQAALEPLEEAKTQAERN